jgi:hypothetical protein
MGSWRAHDEAVHDTVGWGWSWERMLVRHRRQIILLVVVYRRGLTDISLHGLTAGEIPWIRIMRVEVGLI